ncbi:DNA replication complex GINS protein PSF3-like [Mangifera indica]|uniref:DNA replication complex GINS protein PSF3-like n=1 Tax=Mangifera indica TaxID=29780 RepID=UPI001CFA13F4|nr:DNA replication complex GINS protein PSF3-like [Mangifera indica]XP_044507831.1 DNA replication complex GINS protein PSF3-like [Mangifera indica]
MNDGASRNANYYDLDDILIEEELVPVVFHKSANGVKVDPSAEKDCVEEGAKVELPFWLAQELYLRQAVSINVPACFNQKTRREIQADAANVDLRSRCQFFYEFGCKIAPLVGDRTIGKMLLSTFQMRYKDVLTKAHTVAYAVASKFLSVLTKEETNLYEAAQNSMAAFKKWRIGGPRFQRASVLGRKRKAIE